MRYFDEGRARAVPAGLTMPFEDHRTMEHVIADEKRQAMRPRIPTDGDLA